MSFYSFPVNYQVNIREITLFKKLAICNFQRILVLSLSLIVNIDFYCTGFSDLPLIRYFPILNKKFDFTHLNIKKATELINVALKIAVSVKSELAFTILFHGKLFMPNQTFSEEVIARIEDDFVLSMVPRGRLALI